MKILNFLQESNAFAIKGWGWVAVLFILYPFRQFITRLFEGFSLKIEFWFIKHRLGVNSIKFHSAKVNGYGTISGNRKHFTARGALTLINLLTVNNVIESISLHIEGKWYSLGWNSPTMPIHDTFIFGPRETRVLSFFSSDIDWPPNRDTVDMVFSVKDMFGRVYSGKAVCPIKFK